MQLTLMNESYLNKNADYYRHRTVDSKLDSILKSGITVKGGKKTNYTFEHGRTPADLLNQTGYLEASSKGEGETVDLYIEIPDYILNIPGFSFDSLRLTEEEFLIFLETILYPNALNDPNYASCKSDLILFGSEPESLKDYYEKKKLLNEDSIAILNALEPLYIRKKVELEEETSNDENSFIPDPFMLSISKRDPLKTIVPSIFIKYIVNSKSIMMNSSYLELLDKELQGKIISFIENRCKRNLEM